MGKSRRVKTKRLSEELLETYPERFTDDFEENKKLVEEVTVLSSKKMRNKIAGHLTHVLNRQEGEADLA